MGGEGAEGRIDQIDAGEGIGVDAGLLQQGQALCSLLARLGIAAAPMPGDGVGKGFKAAALIGASQAGEEGMAGLQGLNQGGSAEHPAVVVAGVPFSLCEGWGGEADDALLPHVPFAGPPAALWAPATGSIDGDHAGADPFAAPVNDFLLVTAVQLGGVGAAGESNGVEALTAAADVDADGDERGVCGHGLANR